MKGASKRWLTVLIGSAGGGVGGWLISFVLGHCGGTCSVGNTPLLLTIALGLVGGYAAWVATRPLPDTLNPDSPPW